MKNLVVVLSDIHIGDNSPTCWYQPAVHGAYLQCAFDWIVTNAASIREVVLLGDVVDMWTYPFSVRPPSFAAIAGKNPDIFGLNGCLARAMDALGGAVTYIPGNHDMPVTAADVAAIKSPGGHHLAFQNSPYNPGGDARVVLAHGNAYTLFNAPDPTTKWAPLPVGHFVTRIVATHMATQLGPNQTVADLPDQGAPDGIDATSIILSALQHLNVSVSGAMIDGIAGKEGVSETASIILADGGTTTLTEVKAVYDNLFSRWIAQNGGGTDGLLVATKSALADYDATYMGWFAQRQAFASAAQLVVMGHTHLPISGLDNSLVQYVNSGFECPSKPDMGKRPFCFAVIDMNTATAKIMEIPKASSPPPPGFHIPASAVVPLSPPAPTTSIVASPSVDRSCYAAIHNATNLDMTLQGEEARNGHFINLPTVIHAGHTETVWIQDYPLPDPHGAAGTANYRLTDGSVMAFNFDCPMGVYPNSVSGGTSFQAKVGGGSWQTPAHVPSQGHPLFVQYEVAPGIQQAQFSGRCGENSSATSPAGLQPGQSVVLNGSTDLSKCMTANDGGCVYGVKLNRTSGVYQYEVEVDASGPGGPFSGSMYLYFTDQSGDRYLLTVFRHARDKHTVSYNSSAPAIVKIEWSNTSIH